MRRIIVLLPLFLFACRSEPAAEPAGAPAGAPAAAPAPDDATAAAEPATELPYRLVDHIDDAQVHSPLDAVKSVATLAGEGDVPHETSLELGFEGTAPSLPGKGCRVGRRQDGRGNALVYRGRNPHECVFIVEAEPSTHYRVARASRTDDPNIDFQVIESRSRLAHPKSLNHPADLSAAMNGRFVSMKQLLFVHHFERPKPGGWDGSAVSFFTSPYTRSLVLLLNDAEGLVKGNAGTRSLFDDIRVEKVLPSSSQELALLKSADALRAEEESGLAKRGQLLPVGLLSDAKPPYDHNYDYREALFVPSPTTLKFSLTALPADARFVFSYAMHKASRSGESVTFRVRASKEDGDPITLFEQTLTVGDDWRWHEGSVSLSELVGRHTTLILETESPAGQRGLGLWGTPVLEAKREDERPNVIVIAVDTLRADRLSAYGYERKTSPNIDRLAEDGVVFDRALSASNWTSPSFASMFTGRAASRHQVVHRARSIPDALHTLPEYFRDAGYATEAIMYKAYLYNMGFEQGFERWFNVPLHHVHAQSNLDKAMAWLERNEERRFFLFLHFNDPHQPFNQPKPFDSKYAGRDDLGRFALNLPITITGDNHVLGCGGCGQGKGMKRDFKPVAKDLYDGEIAFIDDRLGVFLQALRDRGLYDDTLIVFVADHGEMMWEHANTFGHGGPWLYDTLTRVPLIIKPHARFAKGDVKRVTRSVQAYDLMPTVLEMAGLTPRDEPRNARSLLPLLDGTADPDSEDAPVFTENVKQHVIAVSHGDWKMIVNHPTSASMRTRLFNIREDPLEQNDLARSARVERKRLEQQLADWLVQNRRGRWLGLALPEGARRVAIGSDTPMRSARAWFGATGRGSGDRTVELRVSGNERFLFAELEVDDTARLAIDVLNGKGTAIATARIEASSAVEYEAGDIAGLVRATEPRILLYEGAPPVIEQETRAMNAQRLEALRALGYIQ